MKKFLLIVPVLCMALSVLYSQDAGKFAAGVRVGAQIGFPKTQDDFENEIKSPENKPLGLEDGVLPNPNIVLFGAYGFTDNIGLQLELNFQIAQGVSAANGSDTLKVEKTYSTLDVPLLLKINFLPGEHRFGIIGGPYFTTPLGKVKTKFTGFITSDFSSDIDAPNFGFVAGLFGGFGFPPFGRIVADVRYIQDFGVTKENRSDYPGFAIMQRRGIVISLGIEYTFK